MVNFMGAQIMCPQSLYRRQNDLEHPVYASKNNEKFYMLNENLKLQKTAKKIQALAFRSTSCNLF